MEARPESRRSKRGFRMRTHANAPSVLVPTRLQRRGSRLLNKKFMQPIRAIVVALLALLFVFSTNRCVIAAAFPAEVEECCPTEQPSRESERGLPCGGKDCLPCATLESGVHPTSLVPLTIVAPGWSDAEDFAELLRRMAVAAVKDAPASPPDPVAIPPPPWCDVMTKALPVRGPSLVA